MTAATVHAVALAGTDGHLAEIQAETAAGLPGLLLTGLPDTALRETRDRIRAAVLNSGEAWPQAAITVQLSPAALPKRGSSFDLAIAVAILAAAGSVPAAAAGGAVFLGELGLDGRLHPVRGVLPAAAAARAAGFGVVVVPPGNAAEAALISGITVIGAPTLAAVLAWLRGRRPTPGSDAVQAWARPAAAASPEPGPDLTDLTDLAGRPAARRIAEACAAGGHHLLLLGPPQTGRALLAGRIAAIMPPLGEAAALEVTALHSLAGMLTPGDPLVRRPPLISPHHTASLPAILGIGSPLRPGCAALAHRGVLFLDEAPQFGRAVLDALRQPLETGHVTMARGGQVTRFPAAFTLILAASPCLCAATGTMPAAGCSCTPAARARYRGRLDGPLRSRADLTTELQLAPRGRQLAGPAAAEPGAVVAARVAAARQRAAGRLAGTPWRLTAHVPGGELRRRFPPAAGALEPLEHAIGLGVISVRGAGRVLGVAWTLADLDGKPRPEAREVTAALGLHLGTPA